VLDFEISLQGPWAGQPTLARSTPNATLAARPLGGRTLDPQSTINLDPGMIRTSLLAFLLSPRPRRHPPTPAPRPLSETGFCIFLSRWAAGSGGGAPASLKVGGLLGRAAAAVLAPPEPSRRTHLSRVRVPEARPRVRPARLGPTPAGGRKGLPRGGGGTRVRRGRGVDRAALGLRLPLARASRRHLEAEEGAEARGGQGRVRLPGGLLRAIALPWGTRRGPGASSPPAHLGSLAGRGSGEQVARLLLPELRLRVSCDLVNLTSVGWAPKPEFGKGISEPCPNPHLFSGPCQDPPFPHSPPLGSCPTSCCPLCPTLQMERSPMLSTSPGSLLP